MHDTSAAKIVQEQMKNGRNCCQAVIIAACQAYQVPVGPDVLSAADMFGSGMGSGCSCGALSGMMMAAGIFQQYASHPSGAKLSRKLHDEFKEQFGATCCRVIKSRRKGLANVGNRACIELSSRAAEIIIKEWEGILNA
ncbi:MAG: C-GCAxxG-C-C family protein [Syntrophomonas sp.]